MTADAYTTEPDDFFDERRCAMFATMILLGLLAATAVTSALVQFGRDGYRRTPTI